MAVNFAAKRVGSMIGGKMFNSGVTSCDGIKKGQPCCFDKKEAAAKGMMSCGATGGGTKKNNNQNKEALVRCKQIAAQSKKEKAKPKKK